MDHVTPITSELLRGAVEVERTERGVLPHRLPAWARAQCPDGQLAMAESQPSGVRVALRTAARTVELETVPTKREYPGVPPRPDGVYDLVAGGRLVAQGTVPGGDTLVIDMARGSFEHRSGVAGNVRFELPEGEKDVEIWLPHDETAVLVSLRTDQPVAPLPDRGRRTWLHHGSSISQGSNATSPTGTWPAVAAAAAGVELLNLGFGGSAMVDPFTARVMRDTSADVISAKLGINVVNADAMRLRAFGPAVHGFLDTIREGHADTPLLVVSPLLCPVHEEVPGPSAMDLEAMAEGRVAWKAAGDRAGVAAGQLTLQVVRRELERIVTERAATDPNLHHLDGRRLYGEQDAVELPLPDNLHPGPETHRRIGERFAALAFGEGGPLG